MWTILTPKWRGALARAAPGAEARAAKFVLLALTGIGFWTAVFGVAYRVLRYIQTGAGHRHPARRQDAQRHPARVPVDPAALEHHHGALDLLPGQGSRPAGRRRRSAGPGCTSPSWARPSCTPRGWSGCWRCRSSRPTAIVFSGGPLFPFVAIAAVVPYLALAGRRRHDLHRAAGQRLPRPPDARAAGPGRAGGGGRAWCSCSASSGPSGWPGRRGSRTSWTTSRC